MFGGGALRGSLARTTLWLLSVSQRVPVFLAETGMPSNSVMNVSLVLLAVNSGPSIMARMILVVGSVLVVANWLTRPGPGPPPLCNKHVAVSGIKVVDKLPGMRPAM